MNPNPNPYPDTASLQQQIDALQSALNSATKERDELKSKVELGVITDSAIADLQSKLTASECEMVKAQANEAMLQSLLDSQNTRIGYLTDQIYRLINSATSVLIRIVPRWPVGDGETAQVFLEGEVRRAQSLFSSTTPNSVDRELEELWQMLDWLACDDNWNKIAPSNSVEGFRQAVRAAIAKEAGGSNG